MFLWVIYENCRYCCNLARLFFCFFCLIYFFVYFVLFFSYFFVRDRSRTESVETRLNRANHWRSVALCRKTHTTVGKRTTNDTQRTDKSINKP